MSKSLENFASISIGLAALAIGGSFAHREFFSPPPLPLRATAGPPQLLTDWKALIPNGVSMGDSNARVTVVEFADFECPFCRKFDEVLSATRGANPKDVRVVFMHYPLDGHRFAKPAARASECAAEMGRFDSLERVLFAKQDSLGLKSWSSYAAEAGIKDTLRFNRCTTRSGSVARIDSGLAAGRRIKVTGTPTIIVNGWRFQATPYDSFPAIIDDFLRGKTPSPTGKGPDRPSDG